MRRRPPACSPLTLPCATQRQSLRILAGGDRVDPARRQHRPGSRAGRSRAPSFTFVSGALPEKARLDTAGAIEVNLYVELIHCYKSSLTRPQRFP